MASSRPCRPCLGVSEQTPSELLHGCCCSLCCPAGPSLLAGCPWRWCVSFHKYDGFLAVLVSGSGCLPCTDSAAEDCSVLLLALPWDSVISLLYQLLRCLLLSPFILQHWKPQGDFAQAPGSSIPISCSRRCPGCQQLGRISCSCTAHNSLSLHSCSGILFPV